MTTTTATTTSTSVSGASESTSIAAGLSVPTAASSSDGSSSMDAIDTGSTFPTANPTTPSTIEASSDQHSMREIEIETETVMIASPPSSSHFAETAFVSESDLERETVSASALPSSTFTTTWTTAIRPFSDSTASAFSTISLVSAPTDASPTTSPATSNTDQSSVDVGGGEPSTMVSSSTSLRSPAASQTSGEIASQSASQGEVRGESGSRSESRLESITSTSTRPAPSPSSSPFANGIEPSATLLNPPSSNSNSTSNSTSSLLATEAAAAEAESKVSFPHPSLIPLLLSYLSFWAWTYCEWADRWVSGERDPRSETTSAPHRSWGFRWSVPSPFSFSLSSTRLPRLILPLSLLEFPPPKGLCPIMTRQFGIGAYAWLRYHVVASVLMWYRIGTRHVGRSGLCNVRAEEVQETIPE